MIISYEEVNRIKWANSETWINREYYRENILGNKQFLIQNETESTINLKNLLLRYKLGNEEILSQVFPLAVCHRD
jgi:hypothetical protein